MGILSALFKTKSWNDDPFQQRLAKLILDGAVFDAGAMFDASSSRQGEWLNLNDIFALMKEAGWSWKETRNRCVHAVSMIRPIADARTYKAATAIGERLYEAFSVPLRRF